MNASQKIPRKRSGPVVLAGILLLIGGVLIYIGSHNFPIRAVGIAFVMASTYLIQVSNARNRSAAPDASSEVNNRTSANAARRVLWVASVSLVLLCYKKSRRQQGHRGRERARCAASWQRRVAMEDGLCRSVRAGSAAGGVSGLGTW
jgi:hypothetical protein